MAFELWLVLAVLAGLSISRSARLYARFAADYRAQQVRDVSAEDLLRATVPGRRACLYMRPFDHQERAGLGARAVKRIGLGVWRYMFSGLKSAARNRREPRFEKLLLSVFPDIVAIGESQGLLGIGRLRSERTWLKDARALLRQAAWVVCVPSTSTGVMEEMRVLVEDRALERTLFVMPARIDFAYLHDGREPFPEWPATVAAAARLGLELPKYDAEGLLFQLDDGGREARRCGLTGSLLWTGWALERLGIHPR